MFPREIKAQVWQETIFNCILLLASTVLTINWVQSRSILKGGRQEKDIFITIYYYIVYYYADLTSAIVNTMKTAPCYYSSQVKKMVWWFSISKGKSRRSSFKRGVAAAALLRRAAARRLLSQWRGDAKSSRQIGLTRLYCPHGTTQIIQPRRRLQIYGKVSCNWGNWEEGWKAGRRKAREGWLHYCLPL